MKKTLLKIGLVFVLVISSVFINVVLFSISADQGQVKSGVDFVFCNAKIVAMDEDNPLANALAISGKPIVEIWIAITSIVLFS